MKCIKIHEETKYEIRETKDGLPTDSVWGTHNTIKDAIADIDEKVHKWFKGCGRPENKEDYCIVQINKEGWWINETR